jgi:hypothetical protein
MRRFALTFSLVALSTVLLSSPTKAQETNPYSTQPQNIDRSTSSIRVANRELNPFDLATFAYRGRFAEQGIPGYGNFVMGLNTGHITVDDVIQAGIEAGQLSPETRSDRSYRTALRQQLLSLRNTGF